MTEGLTRRTLAGAGLSLLGGGLAVAQAPAPAGASFEVWRAGKRIGSHAVTLRDDGARRIAAIHADLVVRIGPVPVFRHAHQATEVWDGGRLVSLVSRSVSNGKVETVEAHGMPDGVRIARSGGAGLLAPTIAAPLTHWRRASLDRPLFDPQTGAMMRCAVARRGPGTVRTADGRTAEATAFAITGGADITDWYDDLGAWIALTTKAPDGSLIEYRRA